MASKASPFFEGPNLIHHLTHSSFGSFMDSMDEIFKLAAPEVSESSTVITRIFEISSSSGPALPEVSMLHLGQAH